MVLRLAAGLRASGDWSVGVVVDHGSMEARLRGVSDATFIVPWKWGARKVLSSIGPMRRALRSFEPDIVHSHGRWPSMLATLVGRRPDVSTCHSNRLTRHGSVLDRGWLRRWAGAWGRHVIVLNSEARAMLSRECGVAPERMTELPHGVPAERFTVPDRAGVIAARESLGVPTGARVALFVGRFAEVKRPVWCLDALDRARKRGIDAHLLMVGEGPLERRCREHADRLGVADRVRWVGWLDEPAVAYHAADVLLLPSQTEGFALVCSEAMMCGVPVVRTRSGGWEHHVVGGRAGWATPCDIADEFESAVAEALGNDAERARKRAVAMQHARTYLTEDRWIAGTVDLYERVLRGGGSSATRGGVAQTVGRAS